MQLYFFKYLKRINASKQINKIKSKTTKTKLVMPMTHHNSSLITKTNGLLSSIGIWTKVRLFTFPNLMASLSLEPWPSKAYKLCHNKYYIIYLSTLKYFSLIQVALLSPRLTNSKVYSTIYIRSIINISSSTCPKWIS